MLCSELHKSIHETARSAANDAHCQQEIPKDKGWNHCPRCGRLTGQLKAETLQVEVDANEGKSVELPLRNTGYSPVRVTISFESDTLALGDMTPQSVVISPNELRTIPVQIKPRDKTGEVGRVILSVNDGPRPQPDADLWKNAPDRVSRVPIHATVRLYDIEPEQEIAIFHAKRIAREITVRNRGQITDELIDIETPPDYEAKPRFGTVTTDTRITGGFKLVTDVSRINPLATGAGELTYKLKGPTKSVRLHSLPNPNRSGSSPVAVVGIDFGTTFTSIAVRPYRRSGSGETVSFIKCRDKERFPTRVFVPADGGALSFSDEATEAEVAGEKGFLLLEMKTNLRDHEHYRIFPDREATRQAAQTYFSRQGDGVLYLVTEYLRWLRETLIYPYLRANFGPGMPLVQYVFSLPVLDYGRQVDGELSQPDYELQSQKLETAVRDAGFPPGTYQFEFEPVCASLGLLNPMEPGGITLGEGQRPLNDGDRILVYDSGGGTTDAVLMRAKRDGEKVKLTVERCLGVDHEGVTVGGEIVTTRLLEALLDSNVAEAYHVRDMLVNVVNPLNLLGLVVRSDESLEGLAELIIARDAADNLKRAIADRPETAWFESGDARIQPRLVYRLMEPEVIKMWESIMERLFDGNAAGPKNVRYYLAVGGNTAVPQLQKFLTSKMQDNAPETSGRRLNISARQRNVAVAYGAVFVPDAQIRDSVPYQMRLVMEVKEPFNQEEWYKVEENQAAAVLNQGKDLTVQQGATVGFKVLARADKNDEKEYIAAQYWIPPDKDGDREFFVLTNLQGGHLSVRFRSYDASPEEAEAFNNQTDDDFIKSDTSLEYKI